MHNIIFLISFIKFEFYSAKVSCNVTWLEQLWMCSYELFLHEVWGDVPLMTEYLVFQNNHYL